MRISAPGSSNNSYHAYLLKIWLEHDCEMTVSAWRFSLEDAHSGTRRGFNDLDSLLVYLQNLTGPRRGSAR
jgi:hypothetical protein